MNIKVTDQEHCKKELIIEFSSEEIMNETDKAAADLARTTRVPGFRPGHVPVSVIKSRFRKDLVDHVMSKLLPRGFDDAVQENNLKVLGKPEVADVRHGSDGSIGVTFNIEVAPTFDLSSYTGLPLVKKVYKVSERDVDRAIDRLRERHAEMAPVEDRPSRSGDTIVASMRGRFLTPDAGEGEEAAGVQGKDDLTEPTFTVELGAPGLLADFNEAFTGALPGDNKDFIIAYPADYHAESFAGKSIRYQAEITSIKVKEVPELDEDLVQIVTGEDKTLEDFRAGIRADLEREAASRDEQALNHSAIEMLLDRNRFDLPSILIDKQMTSRTNDLLRQLEAGGVDLGELKTDWRTLREAQRTGAEKDLRALLVLERLADLEGVTVSDEEIDQRIEAAAAASGQEPAVLRARLTKENALDSIKAQVRNEKALDLVIASADVRIEEVDGLSEEAKGGESEDRA